MKLTKVVKVAENKTQFMLGYQLYTIEPRSRSKMRVMQLYSRSYTSEYRVITDVEKKVPVGIQRLEKAS